MAKDKDAAEKKKRSFVINTPNKGFNGERLGVKFTEGVGKTEDAIKAHAMLEFGYEVLDDAGKPAWPKEQDAALDESK